MFYFSSEKVAWLRVDTQTILTIQNQVITKNQRISVANTEKKIWQLRIRDVKELDKGWYMCQVSWLRLFAGFRETTAVFLSILDQYWPHEISIGLPQRCW